MTATAYDLLRQLLPRYFWLRDAEDGNGVLDAVIRALATEYDSLRLEVEGSYDDVFIATCDPKYVPQIGYEIGVLGLASSTGPGIGDRAAVGLWTGFRRRKGMLANLARGVSATTGWAAYVQEGRAVASTTYSVRFGGGAALAGIADMTAQTAPRDPWSDLPRSASISGRPLSAGTVTPSRPPRPDSFTTPYSVAVSLWRLQSYPVSGRIAAPARDAPGEAAGRAFRFDPLGRDTQLFAIPDVPIDRLSLPTLSELPLPLTNVLLDDALSTSAGAGPAPVSIEGCDRLMAGSLREWRRPAGTDQADAVVDPVLGRLLLLGKPRERLSVSYAYGSPGELGGGPFGTPADYAAAPPDAVFIHVGQGAGDPYPTVQSGLGAAEGDAVVVIEDSATYSGPWEIAIEAGQQLRVASAPDAAPVLVGDMHVDVGRGGRLELSGLTVSGTVTVAGEGQLAIEQCTLAPDRASPSIVANGSIAISLTYAITGAVTATGAAQFAAGSTVLDGPVAVDGTLDLQQVTVLAPLHGETLIAGDCLFTHSIQARGGLVRTSYIPEGSDPPQLFQCYGPEIGRPRFVSTRWGESAYGQLHLDGPRAIALGGSAGGELGAYNSLGQPDRFERLPVIVQLLLPAGVSANLHYIN